jgi:lactate racemase
MKTLLIYGKEEIQINVPDNADIYEPNFPIVNETADSLVRKAVECPINSLPLQGALQSRKSDKVVIVVSDITRPIPYRTFLQTILDEIESTEIKKSDITILVATGMHRPSTVEEHVEMFGESICDNYKIVDHDAEDEENLVKIDRKSKSGSDITLNRYLVEAGFKITTGLVEPHFMAGFSGGRKSICPGLVALDTIQTFHGFKMLDDKNTQNVVLDGNPCHEESFSIAEAAEIDFSVNVVLNKNRQVVNAFAGDLDAAHKAACEFVTKYTCPKIDKEYDLIITSSGGYPLDATFYQCGKGIVSCLPAIKENGVVISAGKCSEGIGSPEFKNTMFKYSEDWRKFIKDIQATDVVVKDQWQLQMQTRTLEKIGKSNLYFVNDTLPKEDLAKLNVNPVHAEEGKTAEVIQKLIDSLIKESTTVAVFPDGPYCAPVK